MKGFLLAAFCLGGALCFLRLHAAEPHTNANGSGNPDKGTPKIQFETNFFDFGKVTGAETISGVFKFKNAGDGVLKLDPPQASCDCTDPRVKPDTLAPGESGEVTYTIKLERPLQGQRLIRMRSNDPLNPVAQLTIQLDYTPLYEINPKSLWITLPAGKDDTQGVATISRTDGKPLGIQRLTASPEWIRAVFDPSFKPEDTSAQMYVTVRRPSDPPGPFNGKVQIWTTKEIGRPVQSIPVSGEIQGELAAIPPRLYWVIPDLGTNKSAYPAEALTRKIELTSVLGREVKLKKASSDITEMSVKIVPKEGQDAGKRFDLVLRFDELPQAFTNGKVIIETPLPSLPKLEVPVTIAVAK